MRCLLMLLTLFMSHAVLAALETRIFTLNNPQDTYQAINSLYGDYTTLHLNHHQLIVKGQKKQLDQIAQLIKQIDAITRLHLSFSTSPFTNTHLSTQTNKTISQANTENGQLFALHRAQIQDGNYTTWFHNKSDTTLIEDETIFITPTLIADGVRIQITYNKKHNTHITAATQSLIGKLGEWILITPQVDNKNDSTISTANKHDELWIKIETQ